MLEKRRLESLARECGIDLVGVIPAGPVGDHAAFAGWVSRGSAAGMGYLTDHRAALRADVRAVMPGARTVLVAGVLYNTEGPAPGSEGAGWVSRYAWGSRDYHDVVRERLEALAGRLRAELARDFEYRVFVDTAPLLERSLAREAGLGWIGKNTCLINQAQGSWFFLGEIVMTAEPSWFELNDGVAPDRCGSCRRCIDVCPTGALVEVEGRWELESAACVSYWTIEAKDVAPEEVRGGLGAHVFGCDLCQDVCPWNGRAPVTLAPEFQPSHAAPELAEWAAMTAEEFRERFRATPLWRTKHLRILRNVALAMGNEASARYRPVLSAWAEHEDAGLREAASWALARLEGDNRGQ